MLGMNAKTKRLACLLLAVCALVLSKCASAPNDAGVFSQAENLAGWIAISGGRLYLDEARVYVQEFAPSAFWPDGLFTRHAGENVIVFAYGDSDRLREYGFYRGDSETEMRGAGRREYGIFPGGRQIEHLGRNIVSFEITGETTFSFVDSAALFVDETSADRTFVTTISDDFWMYHGGRWNRLHCRYDASRAMTPEEFLLRADCKCAERICANQVFNPVAEKWECAFGGMCLTGNRREPIVFVRVQDGRVISVTEEFLFTQ